VGYDELFILPAKDVEVTSNNTGDIEEGLSKAKLKTKFLKGRKKSITSKIMLNKMVELIA
jgi:hypothetical protein